MKNILNYSTTEEFQDHEVETGNTSENLLVRVDSVGGTYKELTWVEPQKFSAFIGDGWYVDNVNALNTPYLVGKYNVDPIPHEQIYVYHHYSNTDDPGKAELYNYGPYYAAELSGTTYYGEKESGGAIFIQYEQIEPTGNYPGEIEVKAIQFKRLYYFQGIEAPEETVTSSFPGVAYIKESEEVKYNGLQPLVVEIGIGEYVWEDFGITQKHYDTWKKLILSGHPSIESFGILNFNGASYGKLSRVVYENGVIILFFSDTPSELKVYSDGRCEIPPGGDIIK